MSWRLALLTVGLAGLALGVAGASRAIGTVAPSNTSLPDISGQAQEGHVLTASSGTWSGSTPIGFDYQWLRCDSSGDACNEIGGATGQSYKLAPADVDATVRVRVTATNGDGADSAQSDHTDVVTAAQAPTTTSAPTISGTVREGQTLTGSTGGWSGTQPISYTYQWRRCDDAGSGCADIGGATSSTYKLQATDVGKTLRLGVTATNAGGSAQALSSPSGVIAAAGTSPALKSAPAITGKAIVGQSLTLNPGAWTGTAPIEFSYQWQRCDTHGENCGDISGATRKIYVPGVADSGRRLRGVVTASNDAGKTKAISPPTSPLQGLPQPSTLPSIAGTARVGSRLTLNVGSWQTPTSLTAVTQQWFRCDPSGRGCVAIPRATARTYTVAQADLGKRLHALVKAQNRFGAGFANSPSTAVVAAAPKAPAPKPAPKPKPKPGKTVSVGSLALPNRLTVAKVSFTPNRITSYGTPLVGRFRIVDASGRPVVGARVKAVAIPYDRLSGRPEATTASNGWATITFNVRHTFPLRRGYLITLFVRARKPGGSVLGGISTRRLVSVHVR